MKNIVLAGFMGAGKTTVAEALALRIGWPLVDMDRELERRLRSPIPRVFVRRGERFFRRAERALARDLAGREGLIIAAGGGALLDAGTFRAFARSSEIVCLEARPETLLARLGESDRPLLAGSRSRRERLARLESLLRERAEAYGRIPLRLATDGKSPQSVAREIEELLRPWPRRVALAAGAPAYSIEVTRGLTRRLAPRLAPHVIERVVVVTDHRVRALYGKRVERALREIGAPCLVVSLPPGEGTKTLARARTLYGQLLRWGANRRTLVLALGGGVVGDLAGFVASTLKRGLPLLHVPTTLVAQLDSAIGGKNGVNVPQAKNQVGTIRQPLAVLCDPDVLVTLPPREIRNGLAEAVKTAVIGSPELLACLEEDADFFRAGGARAPRRGGSGRRLRGGGRARAAREAALAERLERVVRLAVEVKARIVTRDPWEHNERRMLNFGHTVGHALEAARGHGRLSHGEAVSLGMAAELRLAVRLGLARPETARRVITLLERLGLPVHAGRAAWPRVARAMAHDKKAVGDHVWMALPRRIGRVEIVPLALAEVMTFLRSTEGRAR